MYRLLTAILFIWLDASQTLGQLYEYFGTLEGHQHSITSMAFRSEDNLLVSGSESGEVIVWKIPSSGVLTQPERFLRRHQDLITELVFGPEGRLLACASYDGIVTVWDVDNGELLQTFELPSVRPYQNVRGSEPTFVQFGPGEEHLYAGGYNRSIARLDMETGEVETIYQTIRGGITCGRISPDGDFLVFGLLGDIKWLSLNSGEVERTFRKSARPEDYICELTFVPENNQLASWNYNGHLQFWDLENGAAAYALPAASRSGTSNMAFSADGEWVVTGNSENVAKLWDLPQREVMQELVRHEEPVSTFAFSPDRQYIMTGGGDKLIHVWRKKRSLEPSPSPDEAELPTSPSMPTSGPPPPIENPERPIQVQEVIELEGEEIRISVHDNMIEDGDIISVRYGRHWLLRSYELVRSKKYLQVPLLEGESYLVIYAHNLGDRPPNTIAVEIHTGSGLQKFSLKSDMDTSAALKIIKQN